MNCENSLHILGIRPLSDMWFASVFSGCLVCQSLKILIKYNLSFSLVNHVISKKSLPNPRSQKIFPLFSSSFFCFANYVITTTNEYRECPVQNNTIKVQDQGVP